MELLLCSVLRSGGSWPWPDLRDSGAVAAVVAEILFGECGFICRWIPGYRYLKHLCLEEEAGFDTSLYSSVVLYMAQKFTRVKNMEET